MTAKKGLIAVSGMLALFLGIFSLPALAQHHDMQQRIGKKSEVSFDSPVRVGQVSLSAGEYQVQHVVEGLDHFLVFKKVLSGSAYFTGVSGKESGRVKCQVEPMNEKAKDSILFFGTNEAGEKTLKEVLIKGENVKHIF